MTQAHAANPLGTESIGKLLIGYSLPAIASMTIISLYNIIDSIFIGYGVGAMAISGMAVTFPLMNLVMAVTLMVAVGGATVCSIELGRKNLECASQVLGHVVMLSVVLGGALCIVGQLTLKPVLMLFGASPATLPYAYDFMQIIYLGAPVFCLMLSFSHLTRASGYPKRSLLMTVLSVAVNVALAPLFIFVFHWGMRGAALATLCAQLVSVAGFVLHLTRPTSRVHFIKGVWQPRKSVIKAMLSVGVSPFLMNVCACLVVIIINLSLEAYGGDLAIGAYGIISRLLMLVFMVIMGISQGLQPILGFNFGARQRGRVRLALKYGVLVATAVSTAGFLGAQLIPGLLARMFTDDAELIDLATTGLRLAGSTFFLAGSQIVIAQYFQSVGKASLAIFLSITRQMLFLVPILFILPHFFGLNGVWMSMPVTDVISFIFTMFVFFRQRRQESMEFGGVAQDSPSEASAPKP